MVGDEVLITYDLVKSAQRLNIQFRGHPVIKRRKFLAGAQCSKNDGKKYF